MHLRNLLKISFAHFGHLGFWRKSRENSATCEAYAEGKNERPSYLKTPDKRGSGRQGRHVYNEINVLFSF